MNHSQAMGNVHPPLERTRRPLDYPGRRTYRAYREVRAEEARLARQAGEKPVEPVWLGAIIVSGLLGILIATLAVAAIMTGGFQ